MPYLCCAHCGLLSFTAAKHSTTDACPGCGAAMSAVRSARHSPCGKADADNNAAVGDTGGAGTPTRRCAEGPLND